MQGSVFVFVVALFTYYTVLVESHLEPEDVVSYLGKKLGEAFLLAPQQHATAMAQANISGAKVQGVKIGGVVDCRPGQSNIFRLKSTLRDFRRRTYV